MRQAAGWLCRAFGFTERLRIGDHRIQLTYRGGAVVAADGDGAPAAHSVMVRVEDADAHCRVAEEAGAEIVRRPEDHPFGERQYTARDPGGHLWTFTQTIADVDPKDWGGELVDGGGSAR